LALLSELPLETGSIDVNGSIGYVPQEPWLFHGTVRQNILFGKDYDASWYEEVVEACALTLDFNELEHGDFTRVGDRGETLSGGQKARINLAR